MKTKSIRRTWLEFKIYLKALYFNWKWNSIFEANTTWRCWSKYNGDPDEEPRYYDWPENLPRRAWQLRVAAIRSGWRFWIQDL